MISLFPHNELAYQSAISMLAETGKAAVIHPTGTGKSFIAFKLCEENPASVVCWLSPSEYIFQTQLENLKAAADGYEPGNIRFFTYARLMNMTGDELSQIQPDYIVLDEFHRAGAQEWQKGVERLLAQYPEIPLLGLSATNIRYLDNQRDMADELFDGNVASEMTLGEAVVRGILNPPKYVLSVFSYQKDLEKYQRRVRRAKNKAVRDAADEYLEALRRALEKADGLEDIFDRHMTDRTGKYIIFCANYDHLCEMKTHSEWFDKVDQHPHVYTVYTEDPSASKSFQAFKADNDTTHLRLLYAIDALNEGIHLDDISGVILLRPTVSPIIYKQQIGRALATGKSKEPVIFDIVNNIENLYSIDSIEREMQNAVFYFRADGQETAIVNEHFRVMDEVRDCRELFDRLNNTLSASWELMYACAKIFYEEHGHLDVPRDYKTVDGYSLGQWLAVQRKLYSGDAAGRLTSYQAELLNAIGMCWESKSEISWKRGYAELVKYKEAHGDLDIPCRYVTEDGFALGSLVTNIRSSRDYGRRSLFLTPEHEKMLTDLGFIWDKFDYAWEQYYLACMKYKLDHGHLNIPAKEVSENGLAIGTWLRRMRMLRAGKATGKLTQTQIRRLDELGVVWEGSLVRKWKDAYQRLCVYREENGHANVPTMYVDDTGFALGKWVKRQRENSRISLEKKKKLMDLGVSFEKKADAWEVRYALAEAYFREHGNLKVPATYKANGVWLAKWLNEQRQIYIGNRNGKTLTQAQIDRLSEIGMVWDPAQKQWMEGFRHACEYAERLNGAKWTSSYISPDGFKTGEWLYSQKRQRMQNRLDADKAAMLAEIGLEFRD